MNKKVQNENTILQNVKELRDSIELKSHLLKMDAKDKFEELDSDYKKMMNKFERIGDDMKSTTEEFITAEKLAFERLQEGFNYIKRHINS